MSEIKTEADLELPQYSVTSSPVTAESKAHTYHLTDKHGHSWLSLYVHSAGPGPLGKLPRALEGEPVTGFVELHTQEDRGIKSIHVSVTGDLITDTNMRFTFVDVTHELWSPAHGDPSLTHAKQDDDSLDKKAVVVDEKAGHAGHHKSDVSSSGAHYEGKVVGTFSWPFAFELPKTVELWAEGTAKHYALPASSYIRWGRADIQYNVFVTVKHHSFLHPPHTLPTNIVYTPVICPPAPSPLRELAYEQNTPIPGPDADPEGWASLPPVTFAGKLFNERHIEVTYTLALAKPLSYTRGTTVPLHLTVHSGDSQALELLSSPTAPLVRLRRNTHNSYDAGGVNDPTAWMGNHKTLSELKPTPMLQFEDLIGYVNIASWWSTPSLSDDQNIRTLQGEAHIPPGSRPSLHLGLYRYFYDIAVFTPKATGFSTHDERDRPWQAIEVEIGTAYAPGARPVAYSPPTYAEETQEVKETRGTLFNHFKGTDLNY